MARDDEIPDLVPYEPETGREPSSKPARTRRTTRKQLPPRPSYAQGAGPGAAPAEAADTTQDTARTVSSPVADEAAWAGVAAIAPPTGPDGAAPPEGDPPATARAATPRRPRRPWRDRFSGFAARDHLGLEGLAVFLLSLWLTRFFMPALRDGKQALYQDVLVNAMGPDRHGAMRMLRDGVWPSWARSQYGGEPYIANLQHGLLYPGNIPFWFLHTSTALDVMIALHVAWAALGAWAFFRLALRTGMAAAVFGALTFAFGAVTMQHVVLGDQIQVIVWMPWVFLAGHLALERRRLGWSVLAGVMIGMAFLAGHPEQWLYVMLALAFYGAAWVLADVRMFWRRLRDAAVHLGGAVLVFALLFAWQLLPTLLLKSEGYRSSPSFRTQIPLPKQIAVNALLPDYGKVLFGENVAFIGVIGLGLFALGIVGRQRPDLRWLRVWCVVLGAFGFVMALGPGTAFYRFLYDHAPLVKSFRVPARYLLLTYFPLVVGAALGMDELLRTHVARWRPRAMQGLAAAGVLLVGAAFAFALGDFTKHGQGVKLWLLTAAIGIVVWAAATFRAVPRVLLALVLLATTYQELRTARPIAEYRQKAPNVVYDAIGPTLPLLDDGSRYVTIATDPTSGEQKQRIQVPGDLQGRARDYFYVGWYQKVQARPTSQIAALAETPQGRDGGLMPLRRFADFWRNATGSQGDVGGGRDHTAPSQWRWPALDFLGIKRFVTNDDLPASEQAVLMQHGFRIAAHPGYVFVWERPTPPLVRLVHDVSLVSDEDAQAARLKAGFDLQNRALVEKPVYVDRKPSGPESARVTHMSNSSVVVHTSSPAGSLLVLADPYYPGWKVTVDGDDAKILPVDTAFRGVALPAGDHVVRFHYADPRFWAGVWIAVGTGLALLLWAAFARSARRRLRPPVRRRAARDGEPGAATP